MDLPPLSKPLTGTSASLAAPNTEPAGVVFPGDARVTPMRGSDIPAVMGVERRIYPFPWTAGNFRDSMAAGYSGWVLRGRPGRAPDDGSPLFGYAVVMHVLDEAHLMNLSIAGELQRQGLGRCFLAWLCERSAHAGAAGMFLEVRPSNLAAMALYAQSGFQRIGLRRNYYPNGAEGREDAVVMRKSLLRESAT
ncbi:MAG: ribosomal protein S18-alanine N-acetyltransferase [Burkholderiaceae bacterium]